MAFITETMSDNILLLILKGLDRTQVREELQSHLGILPDDTFNSEYYRASSRARLWDKEIRRY